MIKHFNGWLAIPHEYLHVLAHRLIGKQCQYRLGETFVTSLSELSKWERLFVLLFPLIVTLGTAIVSLGAWLIFYVDHRYPIDPLQYVQVAPIGHQLLWCIGVLALLYSGASTFDLLKAFRLLISKCEPTTTTSMQSPVR